MLKIKLLIILLSILVLSNGCFKKKEMKENISVVEEDKALVRVAKVEKGSITEELSLTGTIQPIKKVNVSVKIGGVIQKFYVNEGDKVSQNSLIVKIDDTELRLSVEEAQAGFNIAFVTFEEALTEYTRMKSLYDEKAVTKQQFDKAESAYKLAQAKLNQAKARLKLVKQQLKNTYIYAPICGIVSKKFAEESEMIAIGSPILQIVNLNPVRIELEIPEDKIAEVKLSQISKVKVDAYPNEVFLGRVTYIAPVASAQSRTFLVKCDVQNPKNLLKAGMFARITLITKSLENVLLIPKEAIIDDSYVFVVGKDNRAHLRKIKIGISSDLKVQVKEGLCEGEMVVTEGNIGLKDNQLVVVEEKPLS